MKFLLVIFLSSLVTVVQSQRLYTAPARAVNTVDSLSNIPVKSIIAPNYYTRNLSFFCRQELKLEKATTVKFRFRLGSVEQTDFLEGKRKPAIAASQKLPAH